MNLKDKKIFVIGGAGLIGSHICDLLKDTNVKKVTIFDNFTRGKEDNLSKIILDQRFSITKGDITNFHQLNQSMKGHTDVIHLAASWLNHCQEFPQIAYKQNLEGTNNIYKACVESDIQKVVFSSSASVYGNPNKLVLKEDSPYNNTTFYGSTKIAGEHLLKAYCTKYLMKGVALRYFNVYGPRQDYEGAYISVITKMIDAALQGLPLTIYGDGLQSFDFIYVKDVAKANLCALVADIPESYEVYNVCTGVTTTIINIARIISEILNVNTDLHYVDSIFPVSFRLGSPYKAKEDLDFDAEVDINVGLEKLITWIKDIKGDFK